MTLSRCWTWWARMPDSRNSWFTDSFVPSPSWCQFLHCVPSSCWRSRGTGVTCPGMKMGPTRSTSGRESCCPSKYSQARCGGASTLSWESLTLMPLSCLMMQRNWSWWAWAIQSVHAVWQQSPWDSVHEWLGIRYFGLYKYNPDCKRLGLLKVPLYSPSLHGILRRERHWSNLLWICWRQVRAAGRLSASIFLTISRVHSKVGDCNTSNLDSGGKWFSWQP